MTVTPVAAPAVVIDTWEPSHLVAAWREKVEKANNKAERNSLGRPYALTVAERRIRTEHFLGTEISHRESRIVVTGETPSLSGWTFVASVNWDTDTAVVNTFPGYDGPMLPVPADRACQHCHTIRSRKDTYLVRGPEGQIEQVGRNCLTVYTGIPLGWVSSVSDMAATEEGWSLPSVPASYDTASLLRLTVVLVDALGYVASGDVHSTRSDVSLVWYRPARDAYSRKRLATIEAQIAATARRTDVEIAAEVEALLVWIAAETPSSNYIANLQAILAEEQVSERNLGYAVSAVQAYRRHLGLVAERKAKAEARAAAPEVDVPEGRRSITGTVTTVREQESQYGWTLKMRVLSSEGWAVWGTVPSAIGSVEIGDVVTFTATVERSRDDSTFGFYSRPTKASIVETAKQKEEAR